MARRHKYSQRSHTPPAPKLRPQDGPDTRNWLLVGVLALFVARPWLPSEITASFGEGLLFVMLALVLAVLWAIDAFRRPDAEIRISVIDLALGLFLTIHSFSAYLGGMRNMPRPGINLMWEWIGLGVGFFLIRQTIRSASQARACVAAMIGISVALAANGLYQSAIVLPAARAVYANDPNVAKLAGDASKAGSPESLLFANRLHSDEPISTFALTNSLAGFLAVWLTLHFATLIAPKVGDAADAGRRKYVLWIGLALACITLTCLLMTKSRSAYLATLIGAAAVVLVECRRLGFTWRTPAALGAAALVLVTVLSAVGVIDRQVVSESVKSLSYRSHYWKAAMQMTGDHPLLGVGSGQFQSYYTHYKIATASEEVADPHNFVLELAATSGLPGLVTFVVFLTLIFSAAWRSRPEGDEPPLALPPLTLSLFAAGAGLLIAFGIGVISTIEVSPELLVGGGAITMLAIFSLRDWIAHGELRLAWLVIAACMLLVNLLGAGGIGIPGVAGSLWLLLGLISSLAESSATLRPASKVIKWMALSVSVILVAGCYLSAYQPVMNSRSLVANAEGRQLSNPRAVEETLGLLERAAAADPLSSIPWRARAQLEFAVWQANGGKNRLVSFDRACGQILSLNQKSAAAWRQVGLWRWQIYQQTKDAGQLQTAIDALEEAARLYPNSARARAAHAIALAELDRSRARTEAARALELNTQTPHADQKLAEELRERVEKIAAN